jgi:hypothetical protein
MRQNILSEFKKVDFITDEIIESNWLYFLHNSVNDQIKIGISSDPADRARRIRLSSGNPEIQLHACLRIREEYDIKQIEAFIHDYFRDQRKVGEWFHLKARQSAELRQLYRHLKEGIADDVWESNEAVDILYSGMDWLQAMSHTYSLNR